MNGTTEKTAVVTRAFDAPREQVWKAFTDPEILARWWGRAGSTTTVEQMDVRPGGKWRYVWRHPDGRELEMHGVYREVTPPERLVNTEAWGAEWPETLNTTVFTEQGGKTTITTTVLYASKEIRDKALETGMKEGWSRSYDLLDEHLEVVAA